MTDLSAILRGLDDARDDFKQLKALDKLARKLTVAAVGTLTVGSVLIFIGPIGLGIILLAALQALVAYALWTWVHEEKREFQMVSPMSRYQFHRNKLRILEGEYERATRP